MTSTDKANFGKEIDSLMGHFLKAFKEWVDDLEDFSFRHKISADISHKFLEYKAVILLDTFDELIQACTKTYEHLITEYNQLSVIERKQELLTHMLKFKTEATRDFQRANAKAVVLLGDIKKYNVSPDIVRRLESIVTFTYEGFIQKMKALE